MPLVYGKVTGATAVHRMDFYLMPGGTVLKGSTMCDANGNYSLTLAGGGLTYHSKIVNTGNSACKDCTPDVVVNSIPVPFSPAPNPPPVPWEGDSPPAGGTEGGPRMYRYEQDSHAVGDFVKALEAGYEVLFNARKVGTAGSHAILLIDQDGSHGRPKPPFDDPDE